MRFLRWKTYRALQTCHGTYVVSGRRSTDIRQYRCSRLVHRARQNKWGATGDNGLLSESYRIYVFTRQNGTWHCQGLHYTLCQSLRARKQTSCWEQKTILIPFFWMNFAYSVYRIYIRSRITLEQKFSSNVWNVRSSLPWATTSQTVHARVRN